jgi:prepilin-type N-terminal cleavage/methylation domain-containing protein
MHATRASSTWRRLARGLSLVELMVVVAVGALIIGLAAPSFSDYIVTQRVRSVHAQLVTDLQFARSEAAARGFHTSVQFDYRAGSGENDGSCYIIFERRLDPELNPRYCNCFANEGARCTSAETAEIRRVLIPNRLKVSVKVPDAIAAAFSSPNLPGVNFDPRNGGYVVGTGAPASLGTTGFIVTTRALTGREGDERALRVTVNSTGRASLCTPSGSPLGGEPCPP